VGAVEDAVSALKAGQPVILPTDTVYGLCADPFGEEHVQALYRLKGRRATQPTAVLFDSVATLLECVPDLGARAAKIAEILLPGPYTLIFPNPFRKFPWLTGDRPDTLGVRVPVLAGAAAEVLAQARSVAATSANRPGAPEARRLEDVPSEIRSGCGAVVDGGELRGTPSTILDFTAAEPTVLREGAAPAADALERVSAVVVSRE
jgi:L-threonylcarbamoyladenylate synthase